MIPPSLMALVKAHKFLGLTDHSNPQSAHLSCRSKAVFLSSVSLDIVWMLTDHLSFTITNG